MRPLYEIAKEILDDWDGKGGVGITAKPYLFAMSKLDSINEMYGLDSGKSVVAYFLCNASAWRGDVARRVKKELREMMR